MNMTATLIATGRTTKGVSAYLWSYGNYEYEIEERDFDERFGECEVFNASYEEALQRFVDLCPGGIGMIKLKSAG